MSTNPRRERDSSSEPDNDSPPAKRRNTLPSSRKSIPTFSSPCDLVTFKIGNEENYEEFRVHLEEVCYHSSSLAAAFTNPSYIETQTKSYKLTWVRPASFRLLMQYMYRYSLPGLHTSPTSPYQDGFDPKRYSEEEIKSVNDELPTEMVNLANLWFLADYFLIRRLQNLVLEHLQRASVRFGWILCPADVWNAGRMDRCNALWKYTVDNFAWHARFKDYKDTLLTDTPKLVLVDLMVASQNKEAPKLENYLVKEDRDCLR